MENWFDVRMKGANWGDAGFIPKFSINDEAVIGNPCIKK
jgi:hypothetical protein